jgi:CHAD domain-containing protein
MDSRFVVDGVDAATPLGKAAPLILVSKAEPLFDLEAAAAGGADMDAVHDMRVASRRLREAMRLLAPFYPRDEFTDWYRRVRRITRALGPVRDSDVFIDDFSRLESEAAENGRRAIAFMVGYRMGQRVAELETLNRELAKLDLERARGRFAKMARGVRSGPDSARPLADVAHAAIAERLAPVFGHIDVALVEENVPQQHELRISFKRLRYAVELFAACYGDDFDELHTTLTAFQDALGDLHDVHVFLDMLRDPERIEAAEKAGVTAEDLGEIEALLEGRASKHFQRFTRLAKKHPAEKLVPALLLPLQRPPAQPAAEEAPPAAPAQAGAEQPTPAETPAEPATPPEAGAALEADAGRPAAHGVASDAPVESPVTIEPPVLPALPIDPLATPWAPASAPVTIDATVSPAGAAGATGAAASAKRAHAPDAGADTDAIAAAGGER